MISWFAIIDLVRKIFPINCSGVHYFFLPNFGDFSHRFNFIIMGSLLSFSLC